MAARFGLTAGDADADAAAAGEAVILPLAVVPAAAAAAGGSFRRCGVSCPIIRRAAWSGLKVGVDELELALLELELELALELELPAFLLLSFLAEDGKYWSKLRQLDAAAWFFLADAALPPLFFRPLPPEPAMMPSESSTLGCTNMM